MCKGDSVFIHDVIETRKYQILCCMHALYNTIHIVYIKHHTTVEPRLTDTYDITENSECLDHSMLRPP